MDNTAKLKAGQPQKFFHPVAGFVDAEQGIKPSQQKVLEAEGRMAGSTAAPAKEAKK